MNTRTSIQSVLNQTWRRPVALALLAGLALGVSPVAAQNDESSQPEVSETVEFSAFSEPVELMTIVDFIATELEINVTTKGTVTGQVMFNAKQVVRRDQLLDVLETLLAQYNYSMTLDTVGFYVITPATEISRTFEGEYATTKIIPTPNIKPSSLRGVIDPTAVPGQGSNRIAYVDDLGIIVVTDTPRNVKSLEELIDRIMDEYRRTKFERFDLKYVAAQSARDRAVTLVGQGQALRTGFPGQDVGNVQLQGQAQSIDNLAERITIDPSGNALFFRGTEEEIAQVQEVIDLIDAPTTLTPEEYKAGPNAAMIADIASQRGLGEVIRLEEDQNQQFQQFNFNRNQQQQQQSQGTLGGGSVMMVDRVRGTILYYGTEEQQSQLSDLIDALDVGSTDIVIERYPVKNIDAVELADLLQAIIENDSQTDSLILPGAVGNQQTVLQSVIQDPENASENAFGATRDNSFVTAHEPTNVVIVKAPANIQDQFARIIGELDVRRPQVYLDVNILAVSDSTDFRLAIEGQLQAGQFATQTNFGLSETGATYTDPNLPLPGLAGYSAALIQSQYVPFIIDAVQTDTDARILSSPQLLVNDNQEASINSVEEQPTTSTTIGNNTDEVSFSGYEEAGTLLTVTPSISEAGYLRLEYEIELSNFTGTSTDGIPAPKTTRNVTSESVTIPTDATIVVGGIKVEDTRNTVVKVPLLGDIPLIGNLFRDTNKVKSEQVLYIFITPRILNDRNFADLRLLTKGPRQFAELSPDLPELLPSSIELIHPSSLAASAGEESAIIGDGTAPGEDDDERLIIPLYENEDQPGVVDRSGDSR